MSSSAPPKESNSSITFKQIAHDPETYSQILTPQSPVRTITLTPEHALPDYSEFVVHASNTRSRYNASNFRLNFPITESLNKLIEQIADSQVSFLLGDIRWGNSLTCENHVVLSALQNRTMQIDNGVISIPLWFNLGGTNTFPLSALYQHSFIIKFYSPSLKPTLSFDSSVVTQSTPEFELPCLLAGSQGAESLVVNSQKQLCKYCHDFGLRYLLLKHEPNVTLSDVIVTYKNNIVCSDVHHIIIKGLVNNYLIIPVMTAEKSIKEIQASLTTLPSVKKLFELSSYPQEKFGFDPCDPKSECLFIRYNATGQTKDSLVDPINIHCNIARGMEGMTGLAYTCN